MRGFVTSKLQLLLVTPICNNFTQVCNNKSCLISYRLLITIIGIIGTYIFHGLPVKILTLAIRQWTTVFCKKLYVIQVKDILDHQRSLLPKTFTPPQVFFTCFAGVNQLPYLSFFMTWFYFSLKEDYYNDHFKLVKIDSFPIAADIINRGG